MQIVIDIDEDYVRIINKNGASNYPEEVIKNGTPLPKEHGRLGGVLDKIRAEIEQNAYPIVHGVNNHEKGMTLYGILQVIDKYKAESEDKE